MTDNPYIRERNKLPPLEKAVSDTLDELLFRDFGVMSSWVHPEDFIEFLKDRGYKVVKIDD
jgi:hypothetical protein